MSDWPQVCSVDGVRILEAASGRLVHVDELPAGVDPDHDVVAVASNDWAVAVDSTSGLKAAAEDMLAHHATLHPGSSCEWATRLALAVRSA